MLGLITNISREGRPHSNISSFGSCVVSRMRVNCVTSASDGGVFVSEYDITGVDIKDRGVNGDC